MKLKIMYDGIVRDATPEEEADYEKWIKTLKPPSDEPIEEQAGPEDYEQALEEMGVDFSD